MTCFNEIWIAYSVTYSKTVKTIEKFKWCFKNELVSAKNNQAIYNVMLQFSTCIDFWFLRYQSSMARAKRERVVQDEVEKANRRPTRPTDTTDRPDTPIC